MNQPPKDIPEIFHEIFHVRSTLVDLLRYKASYQPDRLIKPSNQAQ